MKDTLKPDWDPRSETVIRDQRAAYDAMRERCPVAFSDYLQWSLFRHEDVVRVLSDPGTFSNAASRHLSVPNGMDPPEHTEYRRVIEPYFEPARMQAFEPTCRAIAADLVQALLGRDEVEVIAELAQSFAVRIQCAFLGWPPDMHEPLRLWTRKNQEATLAQDREAMAEIAREFAGYVDGLLRVRREAGAEASDDITASLLRARVGGRPLRDEEIVSILRNWTVGEVGTISAAVGILVHFLAEHPDLQQQLRDRPSLLPPAIDEILRIHGPLVANRRITTRPVEIGGRNLDAGERISLDLDLCQPRRAGLRGCGGIPTGSRSGAEPALRSGHPRLPRRAPRKSGAARRSWRNFSGVQPESNRARTNRRPRRCTPPVASPLCPYGSDERTIYKPLPRTHRI